MNPEGRNKEGAIGGEEAPCSSLAVDSILRIGTAGLIWGLCFGPYGAGLTGVARASFVAKSAGRHGFQFGLFAGVFSYTRCGIQRYRDRNDWLNALTAGAVAGAAAVAGSPNWKQVAALAGLASAVFAAVDDHRSN
ncbi:outer envelope pore protein 16-4, chloroplastic isoform X2 [Diospyros lotus]|uniref:outer envelope pore protein 16-4, chloroplastic isoform X2 n=1 Tax=Diospyros lotus TaxID=55363 RepID=UPI002252801F|nr:outer envelope pore protein 16-4, chloroplastic isoform X2 [Diospyros lotus]